MRRADLGIERSSTRGGRRVGYGALLFLAPLCGPGAIVMVPLFALRALIDREGGRMVQLAALASGAAVQLLLFYGSSPVRGHLVGPRTIAAAMFVRLIALPAVGVDVANNLGRAIYASQVALGVGWWLFAAAAVLLFGALAVLAARRRDGAIWLVFSGLSIAAASLGGMVIVDPASPFSVFAGDATTFFRWCFDPGPDRSDNATAVQGKTCLCFTLHANVDHGCL